MRSAQLKQPRFQHPAQNKRPFRAAPPHSRPCRCDATPAGTGGWDLRAGLAAAAAAALLLAGPGPAAAGVSLAGKAKVIDGDTLEVAGVRVRLFGIDAPESKQSCGGGGPDAPYACGEASTAALAAKIGSAPVLCDVKSKDIYGRSVAQCSLVPRGGRAEDLCAWQVQQGHAVAYRWEPFGRRRRMYMPTHKPALLTNWKKKRRGRGVGELWASRLRGPCLLLQEVQQGLRGAGGGGAGRWARHLGGPLPGAG